MIFSILLSVSQAQIITAEMHNTADELFNKALSSNIAYEIDESLSTEVGPRMIGTPGDKKAISWAVSKMKQLGYDRVWTEPVTHILWERGMIEAEITTPFPQRVTAIALGGSVGTPNDGIEAEIIEFEDFAALEAALPDSLSGKVAFVSFRMRHEINVSGYREAVVARSQGAIEAAKKGAIAYILRSVGTDDNRLAHTGAMNYEEDVPRIPAAALSNPDADLLVRQLSRGIPVRFKLKQTSLRHDNQIITTANVIGEVVGREAGNDFVILGAHLDSWDVGTGSVDDGIGVSIVMSVGKHLLDLPRRPRRSLRVVLFGAEEVGLIGVKQYLEAHKDELDHHLIGVEWDFGIGRILEMESGVGPQSQDLIREVATIVAPLGISMRSGNEAKGQSDMSVLGKAGMPAINFHPDGSTYFDYHHTENDTLDKVNTEAMKFNTAIFTLFSYIAMESNIDFRQ